MLKFRTTIPSLLAAALIALTASTAAHAQTCFEGDRERVRAAADARSASAGCRPRCQGCGCQGGPGYRIREGANRNECVSYRALISECGPPPHSRCDRECTPVYVGCRAPTEDEINEVIENRPPRLVGCGSRGGPGYRAPDGHCVSRNELTRVCGSPPDTRCTPENVGGG